MEQRALTRREFLVLYWQRPGGGGRAGPSGCPSAEHHYSTGIPDQYLGDADLLFAPLWRARKAGVSSLRSSLFRRGT